MTHDTAPSSLCPKDSRMIRRCKIQLLPTVLAPGEANTAVFETLYQELGFPVVACSGSGQDPLPAFHIFVNSTGDGRFGGPQVAQELLFDTTISMRGRIPTRRACSNAHTGHFSHVAFNTVVDISLNFPSGLPIPRSVCFRQSAIETSRGTSRAFIGLRTRTLLGETTECAGSSVRVFG